LKGGPKNMKAATRRNGPGLTYYLHDESGAFRFQLAGDLSQDGVPDLDQARQTASSVFGGRRWIVDVTGINSIDAAGSELLDKWYGLGAQLLVTAAEAKARIQPLTNAPITFLGTNSGAGRWLRARAGS
jgi:ABC-type transporter Mla MlaB component